MQTLRIKYDGPTPESGAHDEDVPAEFVMGKVWRLQAHSMFMPLAPGDLVDTEDGVITGIRKLATDWVIEVFLHRTLSDEEGLAAQAEWQRAVRATSTSPLTCRLSTATRRWVDDVVVADKDRVNFIDLLRQPNEQINFETERAKH